MNTIEVDVVAFGAGFAGMVAACRAAQLGLKVAVLEKETGERYICSSRYSTGVFTVLGQPVSSSVEHLAKAILEGTDGAARPELARLVASNAKRAHEWLVGEGGKFILHPTQTGQQYVLAPPRPRTEGLNWEGRGADVLLRRLGENLASRGGRLHLGTRVESLIVDNGTCIGVNAHGPDGPVRFLAKAVVIADGGFQANPDMVREHVTKHPERVLLRAAPGGRGDGIRMAQAAGAAISGRGSFYGHLHHRDAMTNPKLWPYPHFDAMAEASLLVGSDGKRFTDEGLGGVPMTNAIAKLDDPFSATILFDEAMWSGEPGKAPPVAANPFLLSGGGSMHSAPDIESLAAKAGLPQELVRTVQEYNAAVRDNKLGDLRPARTTGKGRPLPLVKPPFHAVPLCAGLTLTMGGIEINEKCQALKSGGEPIPGLYVAGTPVSGLEGGPRAGYVGGLSKAFTLGLVAAESVREAIK
jgi:fumarate reductase flavoprotein subunit